MSEIFHFDCVFYYVSDMERAITFYRDLLGLELLSRDVVSRFALDGILFELVPSADSQRLSGSGNARLALRVDDMNEALRHLRSRGIEPTSPENKGNGILAFFGDPDSNEICLWQYLPAAENSMPKNSDEKTSSKSGKAIL